MTYARKVDDNQVDIVEALRARGALVEPKLARVGGGVSDLLVGYRLQLATFEVKEPGEKLNENEADWHLLWAGFPNYVVHTPEEAVDVLDAFDACGHWPRRHRVHP